MADLPCQIVAVLPCQRGRIERRIAGAVGTVAGHAGPVERFARFHIRRRNAIRQSEHTVQI